MKIERGNHCGIINGTAKQNVGIIKSNAWADWLNGL